MTTHTLKVNDMEFTPEEEELRFEDIRLKTREFSDARQWKKFHTPRNILLALVAEAGELSEIFQWKGEVPRGLLNWPDDEIEHVGQEMADVFLYLVQLADRCGINFPAAILNKIEMNGIKYKANEDYKSSNGLVLGEDPLSFTIRELYLKLREFAQARGWGKKSHVPRNFLLAMMGEIGELSEIFQWRGEVECGLIGFSKEEIAHVGQEISDVMIYLVQMADCCNINLPRAILAKIESNHKKYPPSLVSGKSKKYNEYDKDEVAKANMEAE